MFQHPATAPAAALGYNSLMKKKIISLYGPTAVGKTTVAKKLVEYFGSDKCVRISLDRYLFSKPENISVIEYLQNPIDWELLEKHLELPIGSVIKTPEFNFENFKRVSVDGGKELLITEIVIVEGAWPYDKADAVVKLHASSELRKKRLIDRHLGERNGIDKSWVEFAQEHWDKLPGDGLTDQAVLVIDTDNSFDNVVAQIEDFLE